MSPTAESHGVREPDETAGVAERLRGHVEHLAARIGERNLGRPGTLEAAADYIEAQLYASGYEVRRQVYEVRGVASANLEATLAGGARAQEILVIGAHYDTVPGSPGANDNASGVAALLEIARALRTLRPNLTLHFVAFVNEEPPFFMTQRQGSRVYAREARAHGKDIRLMAALETIGYYSDAPDSQRYPPVFRLFYPNRANFIGLVSDFRSHQPMRRLARAFREASDFPLQHIATFRFIPGITWSDHLSFWSEGYRAVMVTDTAFYRYAYYHHAADTPDKLTYEPFAQVTTGLARAFSALAMNGVDG
jgi:Zn-dependent M28 family amino/carboxypeptidase